MTKNEYFKTSVTRSPFNKKALLYVLVSFFELADIHHDEVNHAYLVDAKEIAKLPPKELQLFSKLIGHFSIYDYLDANFLIIKYQFP